MTAGREGLHLFFQRAAAVALVLVLGASPAYACMKSKTHDARGGLLSWQEVLFHGIKEVEADRPREAASEPEPADLSAYEGLGSWIDIFNTRPWANPKGAVRTMAKRGAKSIFLQTSTYGQSGGIYDEKAIDAFLHHAHRRGMKVVAWYVPSFTQQKIDLQRSLRAINYRSPTGERFDSFGLDIEATHVGDIRLRNKRLLALSKRIRRAAGPAYPLSAITPDPIASSYWPSFPWKQTAKIYDVIVPMGYFTFRAKGFQEVRDYTSDNIKMIRRETKDKEVPIHFIGGIADDAGPVDLKGFVKATREHEVMGASLYDYPITSRRSWYEMRALDKTVAQRRRVEAQREAEEAAERAAIKREEKRREREAKREQARKKDKRQKAERRAKKTVDGAKKKAKSLTGSRSPSSSASRRDSRSADQREREHRRLRTRDRQRRRS
jgi:hypothetical protein